MVIFLINDVSATIWVRTTHQQLLTTIKRLKWHRRPTRHHPTKQPKEKHHRCRHHHHHLLLRPLFFDIYVTMSFVNLLRGWWQSNRNRLINRRRRHHHRHLHYPTNVEFKRTTNSPRRNLQFGTRRSIRNASSRRRTRTKTRPLILQKQPTATCQKQTSRNLRPLHLLLLFLPRMVHPTTS